MKLVRAVMAELNALFLTEEVSIDGVSDTFPNHVGIDNTEEIFVSPLQAVILPNADAAQDRLVGIGFVMSQLPKEYTEVFGGELEVSTTRSFDLDITIIVRGTNQNPYVVLLTASEFLYSLGGKEGTIGGHEDPLNTSSDLNEYEIVQLQDGGESDQTVDDTGDLTLTRNFTLIIADS